jgi:hypothetical protein
LYWMGLTDWNSLGIDIFDILAASLVGCLLVAFLEVTTSNVEICGGTICGVELMHKKLVL